MTRPATDVADEGARIAALVGAERKATELFAEVVDRGLVVPGKSERELSDEIRGLANSLYDVRRFWHKRIVRAGVNTIEPYRANPPDLTIQADDIVFFDFGPLFDQWEADVGRTYVLGDDPRKHRLVEDLSRLWHLGHAHFTGSPEISGEELFGWVRDQVTEAGWGHATTHAGHLVGEFPHEKINGDDIDCYITAGSDQPMRRLDAAGHPCHWILEIHLVEPGGRFGGFFEQLLDLHPTASGAAHGGPVA
jgi:Xaa-Pro dipeptidase